MNHKKTIATAIAGLAAAALLGGCAAPDSGGPAAPGASGAPGSTAAKTTKSAFSQELHDRLPEKIRTAKTVSVAGETNQPWRVIGADGTVTGLGEDIQAELGAVLGVEFKTDSVQGLPAVKLGFQSGRNDMGAGPLLITPTTLKDVTFVEYLQGRPGLVTPADEKVSAMLDICGKTVAFLDGSAAWQAIFDTMDGRCTEAGKQALVRLPLADINAALLAVESGRANVAGVGAHQSAYTAQQSPEKFANYIASRDEWKSDQLGMGFSVDNLELAEVVRDAYQVVFDNGTYAELMDQYGLSDIAVEKPVLHKGGA